MTDQNVLVVDWDGPDDPQNPKNWPRAKKWRATIIVSLFTFITPVSSSMLAPAAPHIAEELGIHGTVERALVVSVFVLAFAFGPLLLGPLSELYGRVRVIQLSNLFFLAWNLGCGFAQTKEEIIVFRFFAGLGGSSPLSVGGGVLSDVWRAEERGAAIAIYSLMPLLGPVIAPVTGAWVAERTTWRWVFWSTSIFTCFVQALGLIFLRETFEPVLLARKANRIRKELQAGGQIPTVERDVEKVGDKDAEKSPAPPKPSLTTSRTDAPAVPAHPQVILTKYQLKPRSPLQHILHALVRPFALFAYEPIVQLMGVYMAFVYGIFYLYLTIIPSIFEGETYHESVGIAGLHYIAFGLGVSLASQINARMLDRIYVYFKNRNEGKGEPEFRLPSMVPGTILLPAGLIVTGWAAQKAVHWIVVDIGLFLVGGGMILNFQCIQTYVIDAFTLHAASGLAAVSFLRSLAGFGFPLFAPSMYAALGVGWGDTLLAFVAIIVGCPAPWIFWYYGKKIRAKSRYAHKT
ncbi:MFS general substrate transporter [Schizophyllum commune Tattone D]|nr:MFS general substrate transporter [Schizophyllum commune Tattone D]